MLSAAATPTVPSINSVKAGAPGTVTITVVRGAMMDTMNKLAAKYEQSHQGTKIQVVEEPEGGAFQALIAAGNQPDIVVLSVGTQVGQLAAQQALIPLDDLDGATDLFDQIEPAIGQQLYGHHYYIPIGADVTMMIYNKDLFKEAGLDPNKPPVTWQEFLADAQKIQGLPARPNGDKTYGTVFWNEALTYGGWYWNMLQPIYLNANQNQCQLMNKLGTDIVFDQPQCKMADFFTFARNAQQYAPPTMQKNFFSREHRHVAAVWLLLGAEPEDRGRQADGDRPGCGGRAGTRAGGRRHQLQHLRWPPVEHHEDHAPSASKLAWDFVKFLLQNDNTLQFDKELGYLPVNKSLESDPYFQDPARKPFVDELKNAVLPAQFAAADKVDNAVLGEYQKTVVAKSVDPAKAVTDSGDRRTRRPQAGTITC